MIRKISEMKKSRRMLVSICVACGLLLTGPLSAFAQTATVRLFQGNDAFGHPLIGDIPASNCVLSVSLAANVSQQITVPSGANHVIFSPVGGLQFFVKFTAAAISVPSANILDGSAPLANPLILQTAGATTISIVSGSAGTITMAFYN